MHSIHPVTGKINRRAVRFVFLFYFLFYLPPPVYMSGPIFDVYMSGTFLKIFRTYTHIGEMPRQRAGPKARNGFLPLYTVVYYGMCICPSLDQHGHMHRTYTRGGVGIIFFEALDCRFHLRLNQPFEDGSRGREGKLFCLPFVEHSK